MFRHIAWHSDSYCVIIVIAISQFETPAWRTSSLSSKDCSLERRADLTVGGKPWYKVSLAFGGIAHDRETYQLTKPCSDIVTKIKLKQSSHEDELSWQALMQIYNKLQLITVLVKIVLISGSLETWNGNWLKTYCTDSSQYGWCWKVD